ncbi:MAG: FAD:protein FMN transferase [Anaerovoracaceae bacterium]
MQTLPWILGAAGRGLGCDRIKDMFDKDGSVTGAVITIGGSSIMTYGSKPDGSAWNVAVTDPRDDGDDLGTVAVEGESYISTSGDYEKYFMKDGIRYHLIIDPETGYPAKKRPHLGDSSMRQRPRQRHAGNGLLCAWKGQRYGAGRKIRCSGSVCRFR